MRVWHKDGKVELRLVDKGTAGFAEIADNSIDRTTALLSLLQGRRY